MQILSTHDGDAAQNELFELLGFDNFEVIQDILERREVRII